MLIYFDLIVLIRNNASDLLNDMSNNTLYNSLLSGRKILISVGIQVKCTRCQNCHFLPIFTFLEVAETLLVILGTTSKFELGTVS